MAHWNISHSTENINIFKYLEYLLCVWSTGYWLGAERVNHYNIKSYGTYTLYYIAYILISFIYYHDENLNYEQIWRKMPILLPLHITCCSFFLILYISALRIINDKKEFPSTKTAR